MVAVTYKTDEQKKTFYKSKAWQQLRQQALEEANYECQQCKREGRVTVDSVKQEGKAKKVMLNVHHKYDIEHYPQLALVLDNLEVLCLHHHNVAHGRVFGNSKPKWDDERW